MLSGKYIDKEKLTAGKYNVAIVFTSSLEGDHSTELSEVHC